MAPERGEKVHAARKAGRPFYHHSRGQRMNGIVMGGEERRREEEVSSVAEETQQSVAGRWSKKGKGQEEK